MTRYRGTLIYDGQAYQGFQRQAEGVPTIQAVVERAIAAVTGQTAGLLGAGRTDAGVHASGQVVAFDVAWRHGAERLLKALNAALPPDVALAALAEAEPGFHPRFDAQARAYRYLVLCAAERDPLSRGRAWHVPSALNGEAMNAAAALLLGEHDFGGFGTPMQPGETTVRAVFHSHWASAAHAEPPGTLWRYEVEGNAFLKHMVRRMVGVMVAVGRGHQPIGLVADLLASGVMRGGLPVAPPHGLTLVHVRYSAGETPAVAMGLQS